MPKRGQQALQYPHEPPRNHQPDGRAVDHRFVLHRLRPLPAAYRRYLLPHGWRVGDNFDGHWFPRPAPSANQRRKWTLDGANRHLGWKPLHPGRFVRHRPRLCGPLSGRRLHPNPLANASPLNLPSSFHSSNQTNHCSHRINHCSPLPIMPASCILAAGSA